MPPLGAKERAQLPDSAFAYIDSKGKRRLPIHDAAHVRNALARFSQCHFEDEDARDRARTRLLKAAQKHGIVPIGFISSQLQPQRKLPKGHVTFLLTDIEGSTELLARLEDRYSPLLADVRRLLRAAVRQAGGREVDSRADELFAVFEEAPAPLEAALAHVTFLHDAGRIVLVQPYLAEVDAAGETALIYVDGNYSHAIRKGAMLPPQVTYPLDEVSPDMLYVFEQVQAREASAAELAVGDEVMRLLRARFGADLLYARVDLLPAPAGPLLIELELTEPSLFLSYDAKAADRLAEAIAVRA